MIYVFDVDEDRLWGKTFPTVEAAREYVLKAGPLTPCEEYILFSEIETLSGRRPV